MDKLPTCIGFILDGNRRWAKAKGLPTLEGHREGGKTLEKIARSVKAAGIPHMVCYAFSTQNWKRSAQEVGFLMDLFKTKLSEFKDNVGEGVACWVCGDFSALKEDIVEAIQNMHSLNPASPSLTVWLLISYGSRNEIVTAVNEAVAKGQKISEESFGALLQTTKMGMPDPDLVIRTGGQKRLSNYLLWQLAYSELRFLDCFWPDFSEELLQDSLKDFASRKRNFGK